MVGCKLVSEGLEVNIAGGHIDAGIIPLRHNAVVRAVSTHTFQLGADAVVFLVIYVAVSHVKAVYSIIIFMP